MKKRWIALCCIGVLFAFTAGCGNTEEAKDKPNELSEEMKNMQMGQILEINGNEITIALAEMGERPERGEMPEMGEKPEGKEIPEMGERPEGGEKTEDGEMPQGGRMQGGQGQMEFGDETIVITLNDDVEIISMGEETYSTEDLTVDMVIGFTTDDDGQVLTIQVMEAAQPEEAEKSVS